MRRLWAPDVRPKLLAMSWTHVLTTHEFWAGVPIGAVITGLIAPIITARSLRASDRRKAAQEDKAQENARRQAKIEEWREGIDRLSREEAAGRRMSSLTSSLEDTEVLR